MNESEPPKTLLEILDHLDPKCLGLVKMYVDALVEEKANKRAYKGMPLDVMRPRLIERLSELMQEGSSETTRDARD